MSIKYKIAFLFTVLVIFILIIVSISVFFFSVENRKNNFERRLKNRAISTASVYAGISDDNFSVLQKMDTAAVASLYEKSITILGFGNSFNYRFSDQPGDSLVLEKSVIERARIENEYYFNYKNKKAVAIHQVNNRNNFIVAVAAMDIDGREYLVQLKKILLIGVILAAVLSFLAGLVFANRLVRPIKRIAREVNLITSNNFSQRIQIGKAKDELTFLAQTFNQLLDRLQDSFAIQRRFISNASHELSTPLTSISSQLEVSMQRKRSVVEYNEVIQSVHEDIKELQQLSRSLLDIAKIGSQGSIDLSEIRMDDILFKVIADVKKQNESFKVNFDLKLFPDDEQLLTVFGNGSLLYIALKNIIENGCKYSENKQATVSGEFNSANIVINVANKGDVIAEADIQNIFQPFFRTDAAHSKPGFGLGLTLTKRILGLHKATIAVESNIEKGTVFTLQFPNILANS